MTRYKLLKITDKRPNELLRGHLHVPVAQVNLWRMMMQRSGIRHGEHLQDREGAIKQPLTDDTPSDQI